MGYVLDTSIEFDRLYGSPEARQRAADLLPDDEVWTNSTVLRELLGILIEIRSFAHAQSKLGDDILRSPHREFLADVLYGLYEHPTFSERKVKRIVAVLAGVLQSVGERFTVRAILDLLAGQVRAIGRTEYFRRGGISTRDSDRHLDHVECEVARAPLATPNSSRASCSKDDRKCAVRQHLMLYQANFDDLRRALSSPDQRASRVFGSLSDELPKGATPDTALGERVCFPIADALIATEAALGGVSVVTTNQRDFQAIASIVPVEIVGPGPV